MRWSGRRQSTNVEDRRGMPVAGVAGGGLLAVVAILYALFTGGDPSILLDQVPPAAADDRGARRPVDPAQEPLREFAAVVLADTEDVWGALFQRELGQPYRQPRLVLFSGRVESACGLASAAVGPFYCPRDQQAYLDLDFFGQMQEQLHAPGDFAMAYVIAHEIGHHVQNLLGIMDQVERAGGGRDANEMSVRLELQADYLAGVWAHHAERMKGILEGGDVDEALGAASAVGDDRLQRQQQGYVVPDSFTHGSSAQRLRWFERGWKTGDFDGMQQLLEVPYGQL